MKTEDARRATALSMAVGRASNASSRNPMLHSRSGWRRGRRNAIIGTHVATLAKAKRMRRIAEFVRPRTHRCRTCRRHDALVYSQPLAEAVCCCCWSMTTTPKGLSSRCWWSCKSTSSNVPQLHCGERMPAVCVPRHLEGCALPVLLPAHASAMRRICM